MADRAPRRAELAAFLRSRRERITPSDVGLPGGLRRRTPGLRREEVAQLAGVGVTWYTWLEQGRPINASVQVLDAVARTLRLDQTEREHLFRLAERPRRHRAAPPTTGWTPGPSVLDALIAAARRRSSTAAMTSSAWNATYAAMWPLIKAEESRRNLLWSASSTPGCCSAFVNRDRELPQMVAHVPCRRSAATWANPRGRSSSRAFARPARSSPRCGPRTTSRCRRRG